MRNLAGTPSPSLYAIGRGAVYFGSPLSASTGRPTNFRHLGNASEFNITAATETLTHQSSRQGLKVTDKEVPISQTVELSITLDEISFENLAAFFAGIDETLVAATYNPTKLATGYGFNPGAAWVGGRWYDLVHNASPGTASSRRGYNLLTSAPISFSSGTHVEGVGYTLDRKMGRIFVVKGSTLDGTTSTITVAYNASAADLDIVRALQATAVVGALKFIAKNPANADQQTEWNFHQVSLKADGDLSLIGSEFLTLTLKGTAEQNILADPTSPTLRIVGHANA